MQDSKTSRIQIFDIVRIIAFLLVFFVHIFQRYNLKWGNPFGIMNFYWVTWGGLGVTLFVILSGASLAIKYSGKEIKLKEFFTKRILRIYTPYWISWALVVLFLGSSLLPKTPWKLFLDLSGLLVFTGSPWISYVLPTAWFVGLIFSLYLLYPLINTLFNKYTENKVLFLLLLVEVGSRILVGKYGSGTRPLDWFPLCRVFEFGLGIWVVKTNYYKNLKGNFKESVTNGLAYASSLTYPAYLIHYYFLYKIQKTQSLELFAARLFVATVIVSIGINEIDKYLQKKVKLRIESYGKDKIFNYHTNV